MSWPELRLSLLPQAMQLTLAADGVQMQALDLFGRAVLPPHKLPLPAAVEGQPIWQPWLEALREWLSVRPQQKFAWHVQLSDRFVHYQQLPWRPGIVAPRERLAYAGHRFREVFGDAAAHWQIALADTAPGASGLACGVDGELLAGLRSFGKQVKLVSVQPVFIAAYNRRRRQCKGRQFLFAHVEPGRVCMALFKSGQSAGVRNEASTESWPQALVGIQRRLQMLDASEAAACPIYVSGDLQGIPVPHLLGSAPVHVLGAAA